MEMILRSRNGNVFWAANWILKSTHLRNSRHSKCDWHDSNGQLATKGSFGPVCSSIVREWAGTKNPHWWNTYKCRSQFEYFLITMTMNMETEILCWSNLQLVLTQYESRFRIPAKVAFGHSTINQVLFGAVQRPSRHVELIQYQLPVMIHVFG